MTTVTLRGYQEEEVAFMVERGRAINGSEMGCVAGDAVLHINRAGKGFRCTIAAAYRRLNGIDSHPNYNWAASIPTYARALCEGQLRQHRVLEILNKGTKAVLRITLESGRSIKVTPDHEIAVPDGGWLAAEQLSVGDVVVVNGKFIDDDGYVRVTGQHDHPRRWSNGQVYEHILVMERELGRPIDRSEEVHHRDLNRANNDPKNLRIMPATEHKRIHADHTRLHGSYGRGYVEFFPSTERVVGIEPAGVEEVYDLVMDDPHHNFVANGFVVHNCGKTVTALVAARKLVPPGEDILVLAPKNALGVWRRHIGSILGEPVTMYTGAPDERPTIHLKGSGFVVAPYSMMPEILWRRHEWPLIIADEAHCLRNRKTETLYKLFCQFQYDNLFVLTGSPIVNNLDDLWTLLHLVDPVEFRGYWPFINKYFYKSPGDFGGYIIGELRNSVKFKELLRQYMIRHTKAQVVTELPAKIRQDIPVEMTAVQRDAYEQVAEEMLVQWPSGEILLVPNAVAKVTRLRQILVTPALIGGPHSSGAFDLLEAALENEFDAGRACVVFTPFAEALPLLEKVADKLKARSGVIRGGMSANRLDATVYDFEASDTRRKVLLASTRMSTSWTAVSAASSFHLGQDWAPMYNYQAEDRLHRMGQRDVVHANYFIHYGTIEDRVLDILNRKVAAGDVLKQLSLVYGLRELLFPGGDNGNARATAPVMASIGEVLGDRA